MTSVACQLRESLREDRAEGIVSEAATAACERIIGALGPLLDSYPTARCAAFGEEGGGASLVLQSDVTGRRVDFRVCAGGSAVSAIEIDENMTGKTTDVDLDDWPAMRRIAALAIIHDQFVRDR